MKVEEAEEFGDTIWKSLKQKGITLVEVNFQYPEEIK
jgi:hypothetical protein